MYGLLDQLEKVQVSQTEVELELVLVSTILVSKKKLMFSEFFSYV